MGLMHRIRQWFAGADDAPAECCRNGHELTQVNTYIRPDGRGRECRTCRREAAARRRDKSNQPNYGRSQEG